MSEVTVGYHPHIHWTKAADWSLAFAALSVIMKLPVTGEPIAIIGTGCHFPGNADTPSKLWDLLCKPRDLLESLDDRFNPAGWHHVNGKHHGHCNVQQSYLLTGKGRHRRFDAQFFGINAVEASTMDPQMRLLLETVYEALESAGQRIESLRGSSTAVYTGVRIVGESVVF
jgi:hybrid polyketide synthase/nonribosomal peptide synthetase ACE1